MNNHDKNSKFWDIEYLWNAVYNSYCSERPQIFEQIKQEKLEKVINGLIWLLNSPYTPVRQNTIAIEKYFRMPLESKAFLLDDNINFLSLRGIIDRVDKVDNDTIEIVDYKSGSDIDYDAPKRQKLDPISLKKKIQPRIYHLAAKHLFPEYSNILVTFNYISEKNAITTLFVNSDAQDTLDILEKRYKAIQSNLDPSRILNTGEKWRCKYMCGLNDDLTCSRVWDEKNKMGLNFVTNKYVTLNYKPKAV